MIVPAGNTGLDAHEQVADAGGRGTERAAASGIRSRPAARTASGDRIRLSAGARTSRTDRRTIRHTNR